MEKNYKQFVDKLNRYIRKFYLFQLIRGLILFFILVIIYFSLITSLEYFNYFEPEIKSLLIVITFLLTLFICIYFLIIPVIKLFGLGKRLSYFDVSFLLRKTYPEIKDKLINITELANESNIVYSNELKKASIDQKIDELKIFRFSDAIRFKELKTIAITLFIIIILFSIIFIKSPDYFTESSIRLVRFSQKYEKPASYSFELENKKLEIVSGETIELILQCKGKKISEMIYVNIGGNNFLMTRKEGKYFYNIENINSSISIYFTDKKIISEVYKITVLNKPYISSFSVFIQPPSYTNLETETMQNIGDLKIVAGSTVKWTFNTIDTDSLVMLLNDGTKKPGKRNGNSFELIKTIYNDEEYRVTIMNSKLKDENNLAYNIKTISDLFPEIKVVQARDTIDFKSFNFKGNIIDDYGFNQLCFNISCEGKDSIIKIPFTPFLLNQNFFYSFNFESVKHFGKSFRYFFSVYDNDEINRYKRSISETFTFSFPEYQDIISIENSDLNSIDNLFNKSGKLSEDIQQELKDLKMRQINSQISEWEKFQKVKDIMNKKNELENVLKQINMQNKDANNFQNSFTEDKLELLKKQEQIEQLLNEVFSDDLKKLFNEFNELAKQFDSKKFEQLSGNLDFGMENLSKQLNRNVQLLKKMKVEQKIERIIQELKKLSVSEKAIREKIEKRSDLMQIKKEENENSEIFQTVENDYKWILEFNKTLEKPMNLFNFDNEFSSIKKLYEIVITDLERVSLRKTSTAIENIYDSLDQLIFAMEQMLRNNKHVQNQVNIEDLKQILGNLILVSFDQEKLLNKLGAIDINNPQINELKMSQKDLERRVVFIKDSLFALSKRTPEIGSVINKEMESLENSVVSSLENLETGNTGGSQMFEQYGITAANNLALFISEALENIKKQDQNGQAGDGDCDNTGGKGAKPGMKSLKDSESAIKEQLQQLIDQMKKGDLGKINKSLGQALARQEIMQQLFNDMINGSSIGPKAKDQLKAINQLLEQTRIDLVNRKVTSEMINRQNLILSKLLDAEKSEIERDFEDKRESKTASDIRKGNPEGYFEYKNKVKNENELIKRRNYQLRSFYDQKYTNFINKVKN